MKCSNCGNEVADTAKFCNSCGAPMKLQPAGQFSPVPPPISGGSGYPPVYPSSSGDVTSEDRLWAALAYVFAPWVSIIVFLMEDKKNRPFIRAHNAQALALGILSIVLSAVCIGLLIYVYSLYCAFKAYQGEYIQIPVISDIVKKQNWA